MEEMIARLIKMLRERDEIFVVQTGSRTAIVQQREWTTEEILQREG